MSRRKLSRKNNTVVFAKDKDQIVMSLSVPWEYYHPLTSELRRNLDNKMQLLGDRKEEYSGLHLVGRKNIGEPILVDGLISGVAPLAISVDDAGLFCSIYSAENLKEIELSPNTVKSTQSIRCYDKYVEVWEVFNYLPEMCMIYSDGTFRFIFDDSNAFIKKSSYWGSVPRGAEKEWFPCDVYVETEYQRKNTISQWHNYKNGYYLNDTLFDEPIQELNKKSNTEWVYKGFEKKIHKSMCAYDSTNKFMESILGISLDPSDRKWYEDNDKVNEQGLPLEHTLSVLTELVSPYGVEIDRVWTRDLVWCDEFTEFSKMLCIPTTQEFDDLLIANGVIKEPPRFMKGQEPSGPRIVMTKFGGAVSGGHAEYYSPRSFSPPDWLMAISYRRKGVSCGR